VYNVFCVTCFYFAPPPRAVRSIVVSMLSVCLFVWLSVCLSARITPKPMRPNFAKFLCMWPWLGPPVMALRYVRYVLPVLRMTSCFHTVGPMDRIKTLCLEEVRLLAVPYRFDVRKIWRLVEYVRMRPRGEVCYLRLPCVVLCFVSPVTSHVIGQEERRRNCSN